MTEREYICRQRNQNTPVSKPRRIYIFVEAALKERIMRDVVVDLPVVTEAVFKTVNVLAFKLRRQRILIAATEKRGPISTVVVVDR
jgi:hypothetical protein